MMFNLYLRDLFGHLPEYMPKPDCVKHLGRALEVSGRHPHYYSAVTRVTD
jgi:hypothetical protein